MYKIILVTFLSGILFPIMASYQISGRVIDEASNLPIDFANIALYKSGDSSPLYGLVSDFNGEFQITSITDGTYNIEITFIGYDSYSRKIEVNGRDVNLGAIKLREDINILNEIEVVGIGSQMRFEIDRKVFSVDQNIASSGASATEVLENIPSVEVDQEGNISLRNNESVEVWINGKPSGLTAENRAQILQQMPAESIESIEVITNPSAKYSPEGTAGIINIVLKKDRRRIGYQGSLTGGIIYPDGGKLGGNIGANINFSSSRIDAFLNIGYRNMQRKGGSFSDLWNYNVSDTTFLHKDNNNSGSHGGLFVRAGLDFYINNKNTLSISGFGMYGGGDETTNLFYSELYTNSNLLKRVYERKNLEDSERSNFNITLDYKYEFDKKGTELLASLSYSQHNRNNKNSYFQHNSYPDEIESIIIQNSDGNDEHAQFKLDYTNKLTPTGRLEIGWQSDLQKRYSYADAYDMINNYELRGYYNEFDYKEQIHALYVTYGERFNRFSLQLGLRGEYMMRDAKYSDVEINKENIEYNSYLEFFPSAYLGYAITPIDEVQLNYTRRVRRPRGWQINPFRDYSDSTNVSFGNISLNPEFSSALEFNYLKSWDNHSLSSSLFYRHTNDLMQRVTYRTMNNMENTSMNISQSQNVGLELIAKNRLFSILNLTSSVEIYYSKIDSASFFTPYGDIENINQQTGFSWNGRILGNILFSSTFTGQLTARYNSPRVVAQGRQEGGYSIDLGLRKSFFNRNLNINLTVRDVFDSRRRKTITSGEGFKQYTESYWNGRNFGLTINYNFGNMKSRHIPPLNQYQNESMEMDGENF